MPINFNSNPTFGPNSSRPLPMNFDFNNHENGRGLDVQLLMNNSNYRQNPVNFGENNDLSTPRVSSSSQFGLGQFGFRQRISDLITRNNYPSQHRVQVQSVIDYCPVENQPGVSEVTVTEIVKTKFLTSNATRDRLLPPNDPFISAAHQEPICPNRGLLMPNQPFLPPSNERNESLFDGSNFLQNRAHNQPYLPNTNMFMTNNDPLVATRNEQSFYPNFTQNHISSPRMSATMSSQVNSPTTETYQPFQTAYKQNPTQNQPDFNLVNLGDLSSMAKNNEILDPEPVNVFVAENELDENQKPSDDQPQQPINELMDECYRNLVGNTSAQLRTPILPKKVPRRNLVAISNNDKDEEETETEVEDNYDGRTHSLSRQKYGPYTCPKCEEVFLTSQLFAAHVAASHYRFETFAERKKRLAAKYRKKNLRLVHSDDGITIVPDQSFKNARNRRRKGKRVVIRTTQNDRPVRRKGKNVIEGTAAGGNSLVEVEIKEEYE
ncbi:C2H2-like zinc finger protein [Melia azedarach]|uniref:C2H2-like zinc finger protein n=1 Tax=Melia azedarach TaxID=155640 RepID=A0ACC1YK13_MELAZ|nr:C2H2-like zinc finger protein [Melia azedarach]